VTRIVSTASVAVHHPFLPRRETTRAAAAAAAVTAAAAAGEVEEAKATATVSA